MDVTRWKQRFENYDKALGRLEEALAAVRQSPENHLYEMATIQAFEFTIELGWNLLKDFLKYEGVKDSSLPREVIKQAFHYEIIDGQIWIDMLDVHNKISHIYDDFEIAKLVQQTQQLYLPPLKQLQTYFKERYSLISLGIG